MAPPVLFPDAEELVVNYLADELAERGDEADVATKVPNPRPDRFVRVQRFGGARHTLVSDNPQVGIECSAGEVGGSSAEAHDLAQVCRALLHAMGGTTQDGVAVYRVDELAGPAELPDPLSEQPRYVFTVEIHLRGARLEVGS